MLSVNPETCLQGEDTVITVSNLQPMEKVTISSHLKNYKNEDFFSYALFRADSNGDIDLNKDASLGGNFTGVFPMGLIASLKPAPHENKFLRHFKKNIDEPNKIDIRLHKGFLNPEDLFSDSIQPISSVLHNRHFMGPGVKRIVIREGRARGSMFIPAGDGPFPGIIDLFGTAGGLIETRAAQFASHGIVALSLAFFNYEDLPEVIEAYDISYFKEAVQILLNHESVKKPSVAVLGVSKGGDLALSMATYIKEISVAICINGANLNTGNDLIINEQELLPKTVIDRRKIQILSDGSIRCREAMSIDYELMLTQKSLIPLFQSRAHILFLVGEDDQSLDSLKMAENAAKYMEENGKTNYKIVSYKNTGHLLGPPYTAYCPVSWHNFANCSIFWGGKLEEHTAAQLDAWKQAVNIIKMHLG